MRTTLLLGGAIGKSPHPPAVWINASTATIYRHALAHAWDAFLTAPAPRTRKIALRSAMTMSPDRGVFNVLVRLVRFGLGGKAGSGRQYVSWIHEQDFAHPELDGAINLASPDPLPDAKFLRILRASWGTRIGLPASEWMLEAGAILLGTETELILKSRRVAPGRLLDAGFQFRLGVWNNAVRELVRRWRRWTWEQAILKK